MYHHSRSLEIGSREKTGLEIKSVFLSYDSISVGMYALALPQ